MCILCQLNQDAFLLGVKFYISAQVLLTESRVQFTIILFEGKNISEKANYCTFRYARAVMYIKPHI